MKRYIQRDYEYVEAMSTIGKHVKPNFTVAVNPDRGRKGDCYFKYYNSNDYHKAKKVARINLRIPSYIQHKNSDGKEDWILNSKAKSALVDYLNNESDQWLNVTNWQSCLYHWNREKGLLDDPFPRDTYYSQIEAFLSGYYDTEENLSNPSYMSSQSKMPDYNQL